MKTYGTIRVKIDERQRECSINLGQFLLLIIITLVVMWIFYKPTVSETSLEPTPTGVSDSVGVEVCSCTSQASTQADTDTTEMLSSGGQDSPVCEAGEYVNPDGSVCTYKYTYTPVCSEVNQ